MRLRLCSQTVFVSQVSQLRLNMTYRFAVALRHVEHEGLPVRESLFRGAIK